MEHIEIDMKEERLEEIITPDRKKKDVVVVLKQEAKLLVFFGIINIVFGGLSSPLGVIFILLGLAAYRFKSPAMFFVQAVVFLSAAISNLLVGGGFAIVLAVILAVSAIALIKRYRDYRHEIAEDASRSFPSLGLALGILALVGQVGAFLGLMATILATGPEQVSAVLGFFMALSIQMGIVVLGIGIVSVLESYRPKIVSWLVLLLGLLFAGIQIFLLILANGASVS